MEKSGSYQKNLRNWNLIPNQNQIKIQTAIRNNPTLSYCRSMIFIQFTFFLSSVFVLTVDGEVKNEDLLFIGRSYTVWYCSLRRYASMELIVLLERTFCFFFMSIVHCSGCDYINKCFLSSPPNCNAQRFIQKKKWDIK